MTSSLYLVILLCCTKAVVSNLLDEITPCNANDLKCNLKLLRTIYKVTIEGEFSLGIGNIDPLHEELVEGSLSTLKYEATNMNTYGFSLCTIDNIKHNEALKLHIEMTCPNLTLTGNVKADGKLFAFPIRGQGDFKVTCTNYKIEGDIELNEVTKDGKTYFIIENLKFDESLEGDISVDFGGLFDGQKELEDQFYKFVSENAKGFTKEVQQPIWDANIEKYTTNLNKVLEYLPVAKMYY